MELSVAVVVTVVVVPVDVVSEDPAVVVATVAVDPPAAVVAVVGAPSCSQSPAAPQVYPGQHLPLFAQIIFLQIKRITIIKVLWKDKPAFAR